MLDEGERVLQVKRNTWSKAWGYVETGHFMEI